jgi:hypothetical protein
VASGLDLFASARGSDLTGNNKGLAKARYLADRFPQGFYYAGDSHADLPVWQAARGAILVGPAVALRAEVEAAGTRVLDSYADPPTTIATWARALRLHPGKRSRPLASGAIRFARAGAAGARPGR